MAVNFAIDNVLQNLAQSGLVGMTVNDNAAPAANIIYSSLKSGGGGSPPSTTTSLGTIQLAGALTGTATNPTLANGSVGAAQIIPGSITAAQLAPGTITSASLGPGSVTSTAIAPGAIGPTQLAANSVTSAAIAPGAVTAAAIAPGAVTAAAIAPGAVTYSKMQNISQPAILGNSLVGGGPVSELTVGAGLSLTAPSGQLTLNLSAATGSPLSVASGGTGLTTVANGSILTGNPSGGITAVTTLPASAITPNLVGSVNGVLPSSPGGNVAVLMGNVTTGTSSTPPVVVPPNGAIYVVSGGLPADNGRTYISDGTVWNEVTSNQAATDARYVQLAGSTMSAGATLTFPATGQILLNQTTFTGNQAISAAAAAALIAGGAPATAPGTPGIIALNPPAFDPSSTSTAPVLAKATTSTFGAIELPGLPNSSLTQGASPGLAVIAPNAVSLGQMANLSGPSLLLGSPSTGNAVSTISIASPLTMVGNVLSSSGGGASPISFMATGTDPNVTAPTDRPATLDIIYVGTNGSIWRYNGTIYVSQTGLSTRVVSSLTLTIPQAQAFNAPLSVSDLNISVAPGQTVKAQYMLKIQTNTPNTGSGVNCGCQFGFTGVAPSDNLMGFCQWIFANITSPGLSFAALDQFWPAAPMANIPTATSDKNSTPWFQTATQMQLATLTDPTVFNTALATIEYTNNGASITTLGLQFSRSYFAANGNTPQQVNHSTPGTVQMIPGSTVTYTYY